MENKIHDDQLDDYVRKSFEDYEETPSGGMWDRIAGDLQPEVVPTPRLSFRRYRWQMAAAAIVLLVSGLVYEHFYYEQKIRDLGTRNNDKQDLPVEKPPMGSSKDVEKNALHDSRQQIGGGVFFEKNLEPLVSHSRNIETPFDSQGGTQSHPPTQNVLSQNPNPAAQTLKKSSIQNQVLPENINNTPAAPKRELGAEEYGVENPVAAETLASFAKPADFEPLASQTFVPKTESRAQPVLRRLHIEPLKEPSGWYAGLQSTPHFIIDNTPTPGRRPGGRPVFISRQEKPEISADWWLKVGKKLSPRLSLESGVGFRKISRTATHTPHFRFGEGMMGGGPHRRDFTYDLNTYGGSAAVNLRMEQVDGAPVQDTEPISLRIKTSERTQLLRIPLLMAYRLGNGRLHSTIKAGLTGNFFLKNELDISARVSQSSRFQPVQGSGGHTVQLENQGKFFMGYWLSAGAEFKLSRHVSFVAEPSFSGDFPRNDASGRRLPEHFSLGLNVGVNYYF